MFQPRHPLQPLLNRKYAVRGPPSATSAEIPVLLSDTFPVLLRLLRVLY